MPRVEERLRRVKAGSSPNGTQRAAAEIDRRLAADNASGVLKEEAGPDILPFLGIVRFVEPEYGPFDESGSIDGIIIGVGGQRQKVLVHRQTTTGFETHCETTRDIASELGKTFLVSAAIFSALGNTSSFGQTVANSINSFRNWG